MILARLMCDGWKACYARNVRHPTCTLYLLSFLVLFGLKGPQAWASSEYDVVDSPYPILDSDFLASNRNPTFWLDENRVLFVGSHKPKPVTRDDPPIGGFGLYIWDTRDNSVTMYREKIFGHLCYEDGWIHYTVNRADPYRFAAGPFGQERETTLTTNGDARRFFETHFFSKTTCRFHKRADYGITKKDGKHIVPLGDSGNYLTIEIKLRGEVGEAWFFQSGDEKGRRLPFDFSDIVVSRIKYNTFKQRYFIKPRHRNWSANKCTNAWWLDKKGTAEKFCIPSGPWNSPSSILLAPVQSGVAIISHRVFENIPSAGGLYIVNDAAQMKLIDGWVHSPSVSPSGCRLAFTHAPDLEASAYGRGRGKTELKMIDFCTQQP